MGDSIYKASTERKANENANSCVALPSDTLTKATILKAGKQLLIVTKLCDGNHPRYEEQDQFKQVWNDYVFAGIGDIPALPYTFIDATITHFSPSPDCSQASIFSSDPYHSSMWRIFEDRTNLSNIIHQEKKLGADDMQELMRCGINWPTLDMLTMADTRLMKAVWSWAKTYPQEGQGQCAINKNGEGIKNMPCDKTAAGFACQDIKTQEIKAFSLIGPWTNGESSCQILGGKTWHFVTPVNGKEMHLLNESMNSLSLQEVWLNYTIDKKGHWIANQSQ